MSDGGMGGGVRFHRPSGAVWVAAAESADRGETPRKLHSSVYQAPIDLVKNEASRHQQRCVVKHAV